MANKFLFITLFVLASCEGVDEKPSDKYMDIKGFFEQEAIRLAKANQTVEKIVGRNGNSESKKDFRPDWNVELDLFAESDINKAAWKDSYRIKENNSEIRYLALDDKLRTRSIRISKSQQGSVRGIFIINRTSNSLYSSTEELKYIRDSIYQIIKTQDVLLLGNNHYKISGIFH